MPILAALEILRSPLKEWDEAVSAMNRPDIWRLEEILALESKKVLPSTSRRPVMRRSLAEAREWPVDPVPNLE